MTNTAGTLLSAYRRRFVLAGVAGLTASVIGWLLDSGRFYISYLYACLFWIGLALGCGVITMIHYLTGGRWGHATRRMTEAGFATLPILGLLFLPVLFGMDRLFPWTAGDAEVRNKVWLNKPFFVSRTVLYFAIWTVLALRIRYWARREDHAGDPFPSIRLRVLSGPGLVLLPITATFAYIDWIMSLESRWYSTVFAVIVLAGNVLSGFSFVVLLSRTIARPNFGVSLPSKGWHQLGNLILTFVLFWTYVGFGQLLIIYAGNTPDEIAWYLHRIAGSWKYLIGFIALLNFFIPFVFLLFRAVKESPALLSVVAAIIFFTQLLYAYWMVVPSHLPAGISLSWLDPATVVGIGGVWLACFFWFLERAPLLPANDPRIKSELTYASAC